ncbi:p-loop containing nucleoside triphosphate hydrolase protein [Mycena kentingensis (nom. inval.)]|nr:p-loop containing nucleoside triphosphate hydrolase protein [Mycena kentingensis (nom. inval.)]
MEAPGLQQTSITFPSSLEKSSRECDASAGPQEASSPPNPSPPSASLSSAHSTSTSTASTRCWSVKEIRELGLKTFGKRPCLRQIEPALALQEGKDVVYVAPTGSGKTIAFLLPLLMALADGQDKVVVGVTPLVMIGKQLEEQLAKANIKAVNVHAGNNSPEIYKAIIRGEYQVITASPEVMDTPAFKDLWKQQKVKDRLLYFVFDEGHCVRQWGKSFRPEYLRLGDLRQYLLPAHVRFLVTSATLPNHILDDVKTILRLRPGNGTEYIIYDNDRPNIHLLVRPLRYAIASYKDLAFLVPPDIKTGDPPPPKFLVFLDNKNDGEDAVDYLRTRLPAELRDKVAYFHSTMTNKYRADTFDAFKSGKIWGMVVTDAFGMGLDLPDVKIIVQYRSPAGGDLCTLWQRFGRGARDPSIEAIAILLVDLSTLDTERLAILARTEERARKRKSPASGTVTATPAKRRKRADGLPVIHWSLVYTSPEPIVPATAPLLGVDPSAAARKVRYSLPPPTPSDASSASKKRKTDMGIELGSAIDDMVNAGTRFLGTEWRLCYREVVKLFFENRHTSACTLMNGILFINTSCRIVYAPCLRPVKRRRLSALCLTRLANLLQLV